MVRLFERKSLTKPLFGIKANKILFLTVTMKLKRKSALISSCLSILDGKKRMNFPTIKCPVSMKDQDLGITIGIKTGRNTL